MLTYTLPTADKITEKHLLMSAMSVGDLQTMHARQCKCKGYPEHGVVRGGDVTGLTAHSLLGTRAPPLPPSRHLTCLLHHLLQSGRTALWENIKKKSYMSLNSTATRC